MRILLWLAIVSACGCVAKANNLWYPTAVYQQSLDRIVVFVSDDDGRLSDTYWSGSQWAWEPQALPPGVFALGQSAVYDPGRDQLHVFVGADNNRLYEKLWNGQRWDPVSWGTPLGPSGPVGIYWPSAVYQPTLGSDPIVVFVAAKDGHFYELAPGVFGKHWVDIGAPAELLLAPPSAVYQTKLDRTVVFGSGSGTGHLYTWDSQHTTWQDAGLPQGATYLRDPSAVYQTKLDRVAVFVTDENNGHLYDLYSDGLQWDWDRDQGLPPGVKSVSTPSAVYQESLDRIIVFVTGDNGHLYDKYWNGWQWVWEDQGLPEGTQGVRNPSAVYQRTLDRVVVFVTDLDGNLWDKYWDVSRQHWVWENRGHL
jgi:hypothetical protein